METIVAKISNFASAEDYSTLSNTVEAVDSHVNEINNSLLTFMSDHSVSHQEEKERCNEELNQIKHDLHNLRVSLRWAVVGLLCSGIGILALCIHLFS